jgi:anhydro-N-acetylmuramic acid kinase
VFKVVLSVCADKSKNRLAELLSKNEKLVIGLMSGTSTDGVDSALIRLQGNSIHTQMELLAFHTFPFPPHLKDEVLRLAAAQHAPMDRIAELNFLLGEVFADAAVAIAEKGGFSILEVDLIGSHGQTIRHLPEWRNVHGKQVHTTWQITEPSVIAKRTGVITVADFRPADMAVGGQGAPLVPLFDFILFRSLQKSRMILNIGGIANFTLLRKNCSVEDIIAFDTGPGNMVIDIVTKELFNTEMDFKGKLAKGGEPSIDLLHFMLQNPYFQKKPPKSTGRESFGAQFSHTLIEQGRQLNLDKHDILASATELTARTIINAYHDFIEPDGRADEWVISGGGIRNLTLMRSLTRALGNTPILQCEDFGIPSDAKEAVCFAVLANETICGNVGNVPRVTGAERSTALGKICI